MITSRQALALAIRKSAMSNCEQIYAMSRWGEGYFHINDAGHCCVRPDPRRDARIDLALLTEQLQATGLALPVLVRFNDILRHRVQTLTDAFASAINELAYQGGYTPVYPIKVNQQRSVVEQILRAGNTGLEAGSKPELMAVLALSSAAGVVICNGYKDREYIRLALIGRKLGLRLFIVIEKLSELTLVLEEAQRIGVEPLLGVRVRLAAEAAGNWQSSGGEKAKFGLSASQVLQLIDTLEQNGKLPCLRLLHAHLGSQIPNLRDIRKGLRELARYYGELRQLGAALDCVDVGGGLGVDYQGTGNRDFCSINYDLKAYAMAVTACLHTVCERDGLPHPHIISESGRALTAHHAVLITHVSEREDNPGRPPTTDSAPHHPLLEALHDSAVRHTQHPPRKIFASACAQLEALRQAFADGGCGLRVRARAEDLFQQTCRRLVGRLTAQSESERDFELLNQLHARLASRLFCNFSLFQSLPDAWGIAQVFPIMPLRRLHEMPRQRALLHDMTCDSDGCIKRYVNQHGIEDSLPVHETRPGETYLLGFFLVGAYQEILGDMHNLFGDTDAVNVELGADGSYQLLEPEHGDSVDELLSYVHFQPRAMLDSYRQKLHAASLDRATRDQYAAELTAGLYGYTYLEDE
jgi:arginine decarboxylase